MNLLSRNLVLSALTLLLLVGCGGADGPANGTTSTTAEGNVVMLSAHPIASNAATDALTPVGTSTLPAAGANSSGANPAGVVSTGVTANPIAPNQPISTLPTLIDVNQWNGKDVVVPKDITITLDASVSPKSVTVYGRLVCASDRDLSIATRSILVLGGLFECGTEARPHTKKLTITLYGNPTDPVETKLGNKVLGATDGGQINLIGKARNNWVQLNASVQAGANVIQLSQPVDWLAGDRVAIASSVMENQSEERTIESVSGAIVRFTKALDFAHTGEIRQVAGMPIDMRAEVALLTQDIVIQGDDSSVDTQFGGHVMIAHAGSNARIQGVQFTRMGQFNRLGRYPMHWHLVSDAATGFFKKNSISNSIQRGLIVHGTDNLMIEGNVIFNTPGHSYGTENGTEKGNVFTKNIGFGTRNAKLPNVVFQGSTTPADDDQAATFWMVGGENSFIGNVAAGSESSGFWFDRSKGDLKIFSGNVAHSNRASDRPGTNEQAGITTKESIGLKGLVKDTLLYSNAVGAWLESDAVLFKAVTFSDNRMASFNAMNLENGLVVGDTTGKQNINEGFVTYKSRVITKKVTFANFEAYALRTFLAGPEGARFQTEAVSFVNVKEGRRILLHAEGGDAYAEDLDGTLIGRPAVLTPDEPSMYTEDCAAKPDWNVRVCPPSVLPYQTAYIASTKSGDTLTRSDGSQQTLTERVPVFNVIAGRKYTINRDLGGFSVWTGGALGFVELIVPAARGEFDIFECFRVDTCTDESRKLSPVNSQIQLDQSNGDKYFYDAILGQLHLKVSPYRRVVVKRGLMSISHTKQFSFASVARVEKLGRFEHQKVQQVLAKLPVIFDRFGNVVHQDFCLTPMGNEPPHPVKLAARLPLTIVKPL